MTPKHLQPSDDAAANNAPNEAHGRKATRSAIVFLTGVTLATGAAAVVGARLAHRPASTTSPIAYAEPIHMASDSPGAGLPSRVQVAQASERADHNADITDSGNGILDTTADQEDSEDQSLGNTADVHTFESVYDLVQDHYVDTLPSDSRMSRGAARNMVASLHDPYSYFLEPDQRAQFEGQARGEFQGIGAITIPRAYQQEGYTEYRIRIFPMDGSPAQKAGLRAGDIVTHVDGKWVLGSNPYMKVEAIFDKHDPDDEEVYKKELDAANRRVEGGIGLWQAEQVLSIGIGDKHTLTVERPGLAQPMNVEVTSAQLTIDPVSVHPAADGKALVLRIGLLTDSAGDAVRTALTHIPLQQGLVIDLRGDPGGVSSASLSAAQDIESALIGANRSFATESTHGGHHVRLTSMRAPTVTPLSADGASTGRSIAVVVDGGTSGAAEALAESLVEGSGATLVGERTDGNAMVHTLYSLRDGSGFVLTTGKLTSPHGVDWQVAQGLAPSVAVSTTLADDVVIARAEKVLSAHPVIAAAPAVTTPQP